ncbi:MAG: TetR/AcrR family transcriptional regulator [Thiocapsa sp.]|nr:TetR/AcrR family transcriptional regulator [Thiocapsa sp.]MCG6984142.1 TetR/AcrR family transcriptional regulator [Thiocapsa sp.]
MRSEAKPRSRLSRQDWIDAAIEQLVEAGIGAVSVEQLATRIGVTRGSFYHHFADREDLLRGMLDYWSQRWSYSIREQIAALGLDPGTTLLALMRAIRSQGASDYDAAFRAWALHDPLAQVVVEQVDEARLAFIRSRFEGLGFTGLELENRARLYLYYEVARPAMFVSLPPQQDEELLVERHRFLTTAQNN